MLPDEEVERDQQEELWFLSKEQIKGLTITNMAFDRMGMSKGSLNRVFVDFQRILRL